MYSIFSSNFFYTDTWSASSSPAHSPSRGGRYYYDDTTDYFYGTTNLGHRSRSPSPTQYNRRHEGF